jgi:hypothetical protein
VAELTDLIVDLANKLATDQIDMDESSGYYEAEHRLKAIGIAVPPEMRALETPIGWPRLYLDAIEERLDVEGFRLGSNPEAIEEISDWWQANDLDEESGLGHLEAMIHGRAYTTVAHPGDGDDVEHPDVPVIRVESPRHMIAEEDPRTRKVRHALRLYKADGSPSDDKATLYLPDSTHFFGWSNGRWVPDGQPVEHNLGVVPVVPLVNRERLSDRKGKSEITPEIRSFTDAAARIMMDMQAAAELMAVPQRVLFGIDADSIAPNGTRAEVLDAYLARILTLENEAGKAFQFSAAELRNFVDVLQELAKHVASYTGLPPQYLTFQSDNPASAEAIKSSEVRLVKKCERKHRTYGGSWERTARLGYKVMGITPPENIHRLETVWRDPSTPTFASKADATTKLYSSHIIPKERARIDLGYSSEEREQMREWDAEAAVADAAALASVVGGNTAGLPSQTARPAQEPDLVQAGAE